MHSTELSFDATKEGYFLAEPAARAAGRLLHDEYRSAKPFPHIVLRDLFPRSALQRIGAEFPLPEEAYYGENPSERLKFQYTPDRIRSKYIRDFLEMINSQGMLGFLEELTGIEGLIPDPYYMGGGLHEIRRGGFLGVHADFNLHRKLRLRRRLNLLVYLNEDWSSEFGGQLELWDRQMQRCERSVPPEMGLSVVFSTDSHSYHGHPDPLTCPADRTRRSIAAYYYTADERSFEDLDEHSTLFQARPNGEKMSRSVKSVNLRRVARNLLPPIIYRMFK